MSEKQTIGGIAPKAAEPAPIVEGEKTEKPVIRTMQKDIDSLPKRDFVVPPKDLPVEKKDIKREKKKEKKKVVTQEEIAEKARKEEKRKKDKEEQSAKKRAKEEQRKKARALKVLAFKTWIKENLPVLLEFSPAKIVAILMIGIIGGFFYWWNYIRMVIPPVAITHYQCQDFQCVSVEGEGDDQCQTEQDCQPAEPEIPQSLISVNGTETIKMELRSKDLFIWELGLILAKDEEENILNNILVKISSQTERKYVSLSDFISISGINLPENIIQSAVADDLGGMNYSFFSYNQTEGKRLGLIIKIAEGVDLSADLGEWEASVPEYVDGFFIYLEDQILLAATEEFQDNVYNNIAIRYLNFPNPDLSVDYAIVGDKLIIATSRESMYAVIDALFME